MGTLEGWLPRAAQSLRGGRSRTGPGALFGLSESTNMRYVKQYKLFWIAAIAAGLARLRLPVASAQVESLADWPTKQYAPPLPVDKKATFPQIGTVLRTGQFDGPDDVQAFTDLYVKRYFPLITNKDMERGSREDVIGKLRGDFGRLDRLRGTDTFNTLTDITLDFMRKIALDPKWHPVVRINAVLAIGEVRSPKAVALLLEFIRKRDLHPCAQGGGHGRYGQSGRAWRAGRRGYRAARGGADGRCGEIESQESIRQPPLDAWASG